jgi:hypothetical protein
VEIYDGRFALLTALSFGANLVLQTFAKLPLQRKPELLAPP